MNIALIGSGGREHALCSKLYESSKVEQIICIPGNAGTSNIALNVDVDILNFKKILQIVKLHKIDLVVVGPEEPLVKGIVNFLKKNKIKVFGPSKNAAKLEGSKAFMKMLCEKYNIPTAKFKVCKNLKQVNNSLRYFNLPLVVKADGLAAGKGVTICRTRRHVLKISEEIFKGKFKSSKKIVLEEFLKGEEASFFVIADNNNFKFFGSAQDHKQVFENDKGPNTGGMGAFSPAPLINSKLKKKIINKIVKPTLHALKNLKSPYRGFLYVGLMIVNDEPYLIEYNVRMGDPECQVIMPRLKTDLVNILTKAVNNNLDKVKIKWSENKSMTIVLCSKGYPNNYKKNVNIKNLNKVNVNKDEKIYHAGTKLLDGKLVSNGGRVLNITATGKNFLRIRRKIIKIIKRIKWKEGFYRRDIGWRVIKKNANN